MQRGRCDMSAVLSLRQMRDAAIGEVGSMIDLIEKGKRAKPPKPPHWFSQHEYLLQHRRQVVQIIEADIARHLSAQKGEAA